MRRGKLTQCCHEGTDRPPYRKESQQVARSKGEKFQEQGAIDGQIATHAYANAGKESTYADPVRSFRTWHGCANQ